MNSTMVMGASAKVTREHLQRLAVIYVRQSTLAQVRDHGESTARQYALTDDAQRLGWPEDQIVVIDADLGVSGRGGSARTGFKDLVGRVCVGEVGAVFGLEVSRLARSTADLQRLLELCSLTDTLIIDGDGIYDLGLFNDRMLLGLKGTMSEAELHILAGRLQGARRAAAERGELRFGLPVGYVYDEDGQVVLDPDEEIRAAVADVFASFQQTGSAYAVVRAFEGRRFPARAYGGAWAGQVRYGPLSHSRAVTVLRNPSYAGAYVFGRRRSRRQVQPDGAIRATTRLLPRAEWGVVINDHHPGYITWEQFLLNEQRLAGNRTHDGARPAREGSALLQGIVRCGSCGRAMSTFYRDGKSGYDCGYTRSDHAATPGCRGVMGAVIDDAIAQRLLAAVAPDQIALALAAADSVADRHGRATRAVELRAERARYDAARAERAFHQCDPENRLVARSLEARWEEKLRELADAESELAAQTAQPPAPARGEIEALARDLPRLWNAPSTSHRDRKRLLRTMINDITLTNHPDDPEIHVGIHWSSGATDELTVLRPGAARTLRASAIQQLLRELGPTHTNQQLAERLNADGHLTASGRPFTEDGIRWMRWKHRVASPSPFGAEEIGVHDLAQRLDVGDHVIYVWIRQGKLHARRIGYRKLAIRFNDEIEAACRQRLTDSRRTRYLNQQPVVGGAL
ncbi:MAG: recombinase family protein [Solirubrobacteraceae bacterium]